MNAILYILLGLSVGTGLTLIALQERFLRERRRVLSLGESQRVKADQALVELNKKWEEECRQHKEALSACQEQLAKIERDQAPSSAEDHIHRNEHERLIQEKNSELSRLAAEIKGAAELLEERQQEISDLQGEISLLQGEVTRLERAEPEDAGELEERHRQEITTLQEHIISLQREVALLKEAQKTQPLPNTDDFVLLGNTKGHLLPGSVVRALIRGRQRES